MNKNFLKLGLGAMIIGSVALTSCETDPEEVNDTLENLTEGCLDVNASNFSPTATVDDGSCEYADDYLVELGTWKIDSVTTDVPDSIRAMVNQMWTARFQGMYLDFKDDGTFTGMTPNEDGLEEANGTWEIIENGTKFKIQEEDDEDDAMIFDLVALTPELMTIKFVEEMDEDDEDDHDGDYGDGDGDDYGDGEGDDYGDGEGDDNGDDEGDDNGDDEGDDHGDDEGDDHGDDEGDDHGDDEGDDHGDDDDDHDHDHDDEDYIEMPAVVEVSLHFSQQ